MKMVNGKSPNLDYFWPLDVYLAIDFHFLLLFLKIFECKRMTRSHFAGGVSELGDKRKGSFQRMV